MKPENYKGAIFDMDGTLLDSMSIWAEAGDIYLAKFGITPEPDWREITRPMSMAQIAEYFRDAYHLDLTADEVQDGINQVVEDYYRNEAFAKPDIIKYLNKLRDRGVRICVATATDRYLVEMALEKEGILPLVEKVFTCTDEGHGKDEPYIYHKCAEFFGLPVNDCVVYEDALYALETAHNAGFPTVAIFDESAVIHEEAKKKLADLYITAWAELC